MRLQQSVGLHWPAGVFVLRRDDGWMKALQLNVKADGKAKPAVSRPKLGHRHDEVLPAALRPQTGLSSSANIL